MDRLKVIESELVPVYETNKGEKVVYGTELFKCLGSKRQYTDWIKERFADCDAEENKDFQSFSQKNEKGGRPKTEYIIQLATAKEMAMLERNEKGKQVRRYFITIEEKYKEVAKTGITHNVKQLTITSRELAAMTGRKNTHKAVIANIRECIDELEEMGFNASAFFIPDSYTGKNNQKYQQYTCTEKGCKYYSWKLEPQARRIFIEEFTSRFKRMRNVLEGKPVNSIPELISMADVEEKELQIQIYKTDSGGIVLLDGEVYSLAPNEIKSLSQLISKVQRYRYSTGQIQYEVHAFLKNMKKSGRLEKIASWGLNQKEEQKPLLQDNPDQGLQPGL